MKVFETELLLTKTQFLNIGHFRGVMVYKPTIKTFKARKGYNVKSAKIALYETSKDDFGWVNRTTFVGEVFAQKALAQIEQLENQCVIKAEYKVCNKNVGDNSVIFLNILRIEVECQFGDKLLENEKDN